MTVTTAMTAKVAGEGLEALGARLSLAVADIDISDISRSRVVTA